jgi:predicted RNase H-like nuclease (RuvC/YqgF family)
VGKGNKQTRGEVDALRQEVKNLASQLDTAVGRIKELETTKKEPEEVKPPGRELTLMEEVEALRAEVRNLATALEKAVGRVRELEGD